MEGDTRRLKVRPSSWNVYGFPIVFVAACIVTVVAVARRPDVGTTDFRTFYQSGRQYLAGTDPYVPFDANRGPNLNPPWVVASMAQLCRAPLPVAVAAWWAFSLVCLFTAIALIARAVAPGQTVTLASLVLVTQAAYSNLRLGQVAWQLMLLLTAAWLADRSRKPVLCGVLVGVAASWKPFLLVFAPYLLWRREWRALAAMFAAVGVTIVVGFLAVGARGYASWLMSLQLIDWAGHPLNASLRGLLSRAMTISTLFEQHTTPIVRASGWVDAAWLTVSMSVAAITIFRVIVARDVDRAWAALGLLALLISPLGWVHYVPIVTGPFVATLITAGRRVPRVAVVGWLLLCVPFAWLKATTFGPLLTLTMASSYAWGTMLLLAAVLLTSSAPRASTNGFHPGP